MSTLRLTTISNQGGTATVPSETVINGSAKAWVNFNGTGTVAIRASFNVSSITDNGTGDYTVNFSNAMSDANYSIGSCVTPNITTGSNNTINAPVYTAPTTSAVRISTNLAPSGSNTDSLYVHIQIFR